jgi:hypothetical protein
MDYRHQARLTVHGRELLCWAVVEGRLSLCAAGALDGPEPGDREPHPAPAEADPDATSIRSPRPARDTKALNQLNG